MSKLNRILWTGLVLGIAACGDDVTVVQPPEPTPGIRSVTVAPDGITLAINATAQMTAAVVTDPGATGTPTIAWSTSSATVATVSATGLVTGKAAGSVGITATATLGTSTASGVATVNVTAQTVTPATVSISSINNAAGAPANIAALAGQANVVLNLDRGGEKVTKVALLVDNIEVWSQAFASASAEAAAPELAVEVLTAPWNTAKFDATTGATDWKNGEHTVTAKVTTVQNATGSASPSIKVNLANSNIINLTITPTKTATDATGKTWGAGDHAWLAVPVIYTAGGGVVGSITVCATVSAATCQTDTSAPFTGIWLASKTVANGGLAGVEGAAVTGFTASSVVNGAAGPSTTTPFFNIDNVGPTVTTSLFWMPRAADASNAAGAWGKDWINGATSFASYKTATDAGVGNVTSKYFYIAGALPSTATIACNTAGMTEAVNGLGSDLAATLLTDYRGRVVSTDGLGNVGCADMHGGAQFGQESTVPTALAATTNPEDGGAYAALPNYAFAVADNASGFTGTPMAVRFLRAPIAASTSSFSTVVLENAGGTNKNLAYNSTFPHPVTAAGYQQATLGLYDQAGNFASLGSLIYQWDNVPAQVVLEQAPTAVGNTTSFQVVVADDQDLQDMYGMVNGPVLFRGPAQPIGAFGLPYLIGNQTVMYSFTDFVRCYGAYNAVGAPVTTFVAKVQDFANGYVAGPGVPIPPAILGACTAPWTPPASVTASSFTVVLDPLSPAPGVDEGKTQKFTVDLTGSGVTTPSFANPFVRVELWIEDQANPGEYIKASSVVGSSLSTTTTARTYSWNIPWVAPSVTVNTLYNFYIVAVNINGMGATLNGSVTVNNVP
jgi:hypothetical protein